MAARVPRDLPRRSRCEVAAALESGLAQRAQHTEHAAAAAEARVDVAHELRGLTEARAPLCSVSKMITIFRFTV